MKTMTVLLFDNFTTMDALGPVEVLSRLDKDFEVKYVSKSGGLVSGTGNIKILTLPIAEINVSDLFLVPGGFGTRKVVEDRQLLEYIEEESHKSKYVLSVCTGSALLAKANVLNNRKATSNKLAWDWVIQQSENVKWIKKARWVVDGKFYTSSGVTAGTDMSLGFVNDLVGLQVAERIAVGLEYIWNRDKENDPFCGL